MAEENELTFLEHLEVLRWHLVRGLGAVVICAIAAFSLPNILVDIVLLGPSKTNFWTYEQLCELGRVLGSSEAFCVTELPFTIQSRTLTGQFTMHLLVSLVAGLVVAFPYFFWEIWRFVKPGLYPTEKRKARGATFFVSLLFLIGISFGYFVVAPLSINFLSNYQMSPDFINEIDIANYVRIITSIVMACGLMFQLPMVALFASRAGLIGPDLMRAYRRHAFVVILVLSAVITPPDIVSQLLLSLPLWVLYEISIGISARVQRRAQRRLDKLREQNLQQL